MLTEIFTGIGDPGTGYFNDGYDSCVAGRLEPPSGLSAKVKPNTKIVVPIVCTLEAKSETDTEAKAKADAEAKADADAKVKADAKAKADAEAKAKAKAKADV